MSPELAESSIDVIHGKIQVIDNLDLPFFFLDMAGTITYANAAAFQTLGYSREELIGTGISDLDTALTESIWEDIRESICNETSLSYESHIYTRAGLIIPYEFRFQYTEAAGGEFISAMAFDITERKNVEGDILAARESALENAIQLREKTRVAEEALTRVNQLKQKQDGDYYLTSLLLQPFQVNRAQSRTIHVDWLIRQKTQFTYKKWHAEIGGDFCSAETITLMGRDYTLFVIADAMGKANQGASGALILATIISTYVNRTRKTQHLGGLYPERWLRLLFDELHAGFEGFEGLMMIATVIGLIDETSRYMYFVNAEQPRPVSYREGAATYVGSANPRPKIGMPGDREQPCIELHRLHPGETVIFGSDGRDDIRLHGGTDVNYDDSMFLSIVSEAKGNLTEIRERTERIGEIIDDYSLLRIRTDAEALPAEAQAVTDLLACYREYEDLSAIESLLETNPNHIQSLAILANHHMKSGDTWRSIAFLQRYSDLRPDDLKAINSLVALHCRLHKLECAADIAERITYRTYNQAELPLRNKILSLLAAIYKKTGNPRQANIRAKIIAGDKNQSAGLPV